MTYFPLDRDILSSSLWAQGTPEQVKVFLYLMLVADVRTGIVDDADPGIALRCGLPLDVTTAALDWLASPDPYSRTKDFEGRRIKRLPQGGIRLLTYSVHRDKDYSTPRVRRWRERRKTETGNAVSTVSGTVGNDGHGHEQEHGQTKPTPGEAPASPVVVEPTDYVPVDQAVCPDCQKPAVIRGKARFAEPGDAPGWVCAKRLGGCGTVFDVSTREILEQLPEQQRAAVRRSVERVKGGNGKAPPDPGARQFTPEEKAKAAAERDRGLAALRAGYGGSAASGRN